MYVGGKLDGLRVISIHWRMRICIYVTRIRKGNGNLLVEVTALNVIEKNEL